jgi:hypothetical protein
MSCIARPQRRLRAFCSTDCEYPSMVTRPQRDLNVQSALQCWVSSIRIPRLRTNATRWERTGRNYTDYTASRGIARVAEVPHKRRSGGSVIIPIPLTCPHSQPISISGERLDPSHNWHFQVVSLDSILGLELPPTSYILCSSLLSTTFWLQVDPLTLRPTRCRRLSSIRTTPRSGHLSYNNIL